MSAKILIAGESWTSVTTHIKGFDHFVTSTYQEGVEFLQQALEQAGYEVVYLPNHKAGELFPYTMEEISQYCCVILSDIGSNTLLLPSATFEKSSSKPNRCTLIREYVLQGGGLLMVGGYMSFSGIDAKSRYGQTAVQDVLPVTCLTVDDREEHPEGVRPQIASTHPLLAGMPQEWPKLLGYNKTIARDNCPVLATVGSAPLLAVGEFGSGRSAVFTSDCAPHWAPPDFVSWAHYNTLWKNIADYLSKKS